MIETVTAAPILNTPHFDSVFGKNLIPLNREGHPHHYEFVALPNTVFEIQEIYPQHAHSIYRVHCSFYPSQTLYIDSRFVRPAKKRLSEHSLPSCEKILDFMLSLIGRPYVWGGNWSAGIPEMLHYYPPPGPIDPKMQNYWTFSGVDCSGLLFEATGGHTPRNTAQLFSFGTEIPIKNLSAKEIAARLQPLDALIYLGHVLFALDTHQIVESKYPFGVRLCNAIERIEELQQEQRNFCLRRFFS